MNEGFRQRLVGAVVLACLALIFWPMVFTNVSSPEVDRRSQIPAMPSFEKYSVAQPLRPENIDPVTSDSASLTVDTVTSDEVVTDAVVDLAEAEVETELVDNTVAQQAAVDVAVADKSNEMLGAADQPTLDQRGLPVSWVLQVASFAKEANANEVKLKLQGEGYKAYARKVSTDAGASTRVFIGPRLTKQSLLGDKSKIDKLFQVDSIIVAFKP